MGADGVFEIALFYKGETKAVVGNGGIRLELNALLQGGNRLLRPTLGREHHAKADMEGREIRLELDGLLVGSDGVAQAWLFAKGRTQAAVGGGAFGADRQSRRVKANRLVELRRLL